ncbi:hypothetical protein B0H13DRAFT_2414093, partial [Mycena leptocephala]
VNIVWTDKEPPPLACLFGRRPKKYDILIYDGSIKRLTSMSQLSYRRMTLPGTSKVGLISSTAVETEGGKALVVGRAIYFMEIFQYLLREKIKGASMLHNPRLSGAFVSLGDFMDLYWRCTFGNPAYCYLDFKAVEECLDRAFCKYPSGFDFWICRSANNLTVELIPGRSSSIIHCDMSANELLQLFTPVIHQSDFPQITLGKTNVLVVPVHDTVHGTWAEHSRRFSPFSVCCPVVDFPLLALVSFDDFLRLYRHSRRAVMYTYANCTLNFKAVEGYLGSMFTRYPAGFVSLRYILGL